MGILKTLIILVALGGLLTGLPSETTAAVVPPKSAAFVSAPAEGADPPVVARAANAPRDESERAEEILSGLAGAYTHLDDVTVSMGATPKGEQAVAYYLDGEIVVNPAHEASIEKILAHEVWHVIDWRDNGRLDWGENIPPSNSSDYLKR
jgi:hypothetical protein